MLVYTRILLLVALATAVSGQTFVAQNNNSAELAAARAVAVNVPNDTPSFTGGGLVMEREVNGTERKVFLVFSVPGGYVAQGVGCPGDVASARPLGDFFLESSQQVQWALIHDTALAGTANPFGPRPCYVDVVKAGGGQIGRALVDISGWQQSSAPTFSVTGESVSAKDGKYRLTTGTLPTDAVIILGRGALGKVETVALGVTTVVFPANIYLPPAGPTTLTLCSKGRCGSVVYERRLEVQTPLPTVQ